MNSTSGENIPDDAIIEAGLAECAKEDIHLPDAIQAYGTLIVCDATTGLIQRCSENISNWLGLTVDSTVGQLITNLLNISTESLNDWRSLARRDSTFFIGAMKLAGQARTFEVTVHHSASESAELLLFEFVPDWSTKNASVDDIELLDRLAKTMREVRGSESVEVFKNSSVDAVRRFLGYDRVMLYRFAEDWSGEVLAEAAAEGLEPRFIGQRFPASDIPSQARELYTRNLLRVIADVDAKSCALFPSVDRREQKIDQSLCLLRQPSEMHLTYLRNMGVKATLTISLMHEGRLWGMLACHHHEPRVPPEHHRRSALVACELIAEGMISRLDSLLRMADLSWSQKALNAISLLEKKLRNIVSMEAGWALLDQALADWVGSEHTFGRLNGISWGNPVLSERATTDLLTRLHSVPPDTPLVTDSVKTWGWQESDCLSKKPLVGLLAISSSGDCENYIVVMRTEWKQTIKWGGNPDRYTWFNSTDGRLLLGARRSFDLWLQTIAGRSQPWRENEIDVFIKLVHLAVRKHTQSMLRTTNERNRLLGASLELLHDMVVVTEAEAQPGLQSRRITYVNPAVCAHTGYSKDELIGFSPSIFQGPGTDPIKIARISKSLKQWKPIQENLINYKKDGTPYWIDIKIVPIADNNGQFTHWISIQRDISEYIRAQNEIENKNERIEGVLAATGAGTWSYDFVSGFWFLDKYAADILGLQSDDVNNLSDGSLIDLIHREDVHQLINARSRHVNGETKFKDAVFRIRHSDGHWVWVRSRGQVIRFTPDRRPAFMIGTYTDVSERILLRNQLEKQQQFVLDITDKLPGVVCQIHKDGSGKYSIPFSNQKISGYFGAAAFEFKKNPSKIFKCINPRDLRALKIAFDLSASNFSVVRQRFKLQNDTFSQRPVILEIIAIPQSELDGSRLWHGFIADITDSVLLEEEVKRTHSELNAIIAAVPDILLSLNIDYVVLTAHAPSSLIFGVPQNSLIGCRLTKILEEPAASIFNEAIVRATHIGFVQNVELPISQEGNIHYYECSVAVKRQSDTEEPAGYVVTIRDVSDRKGAQDQVALLAYHDPLTGLFNRRALQERLERISLQAAERNSQYAVLFIDLDHFKDLNDAHGHHAGDELLKQVASRMHAEIRHSDLLARLGGDEFVVVIPDLHPGIQAQGVAKRVADSLIDCVNAPFQLGDLAYKISCSIGIAIGQGGDDNFGVAEVMKSADIAMYQAKSVGRGSSYFFDEDIQKSIILRSAVEQDLRLAIERQELVLYFQPIVDGDRIVVGHEALVRWQHPKRGLVPPSDFIPVAEHCGLIVPIGFWVLQTVVNLLAKRQAVAPQDKRYISVNISALQIQQANFVDEAWKIIRSADINSDLIRFELTESLLHNDLEGTIKKMDRMRSNGISFSLDDFGTGYSSMSYIRRLPLDQLKIDRSFVADLPWDNDGKAIAGLIVQLANVINLTVVAEGVENEEQLDYLKSLGCHYFQGYLFGKPVPI